MKKILFFYLAVFFSCNVFAQGKMLHVIKKGGERVSISLDKLPILKIFEGNLQVSTNDRTLFVFPLNDLKNYYYTDDSSTKIDDVNGDKTLKIEVEENHINVYGNNRKSTLQVYDVNGRIVYSTATNECGVASIGRDILTKGVYIFKVDNNSVKYMVK